ncbi:ATP-grasp domain-containing protein [Candidatus Uabimicrobium amorphum]|uniref:ATP-grasp domain-containing protein n=1 Tax=Uabimicrobium amorphum TaxID=2596890 RepID=A0A5S9IPF5_UABAM|nr:ATP-grasp domain-containing protein [Candidatus Uabimicrobium amorphum]BBM85196.1 hypothetical protein UABAM_03559 [Candidatus Uabimicrobium amorphum]
MIIFSEYISTNSESSRDLQKMTQTAQTLGCRVYFIPGDFTDCENAANALCYVPQQPNPTTAVCIGYIPTLDYYREIYNVAKDKNIYLINTPQEYELAEHFHLYYPFIKDLTPKSHFIHTSDEISQQNFTFPVFVKGSVLSLKSQGTDSCIAHNKNQLHEIVNKLFTHYNKRTVGTVIVREYVKLRHVRKSSQGFPFGREYRVFLYKGQVLAYGYYWDGEDELAQLSPQEEKQVLQLATQVAKRIATPYIAIDIGQLETEEWIVIEVGDGQYCGATHVPLFTLWNQLVEQTKDPKAKRHLFGTS